MSSQVANDGFGHQYSLRSTSFKTIMINWYMKKIFADFNNTDVNGDVRLNCLGTLEDIKNGEIILREGLEILLDDYDSIKTIGRCKFSASESIWIAEVNWNALEMY